jgi:hypothetical protein
MRHGWEGQSDVDAIKGAIKSTSRLAVAPRSTERPCVIGAANAAVPVPLASPEFGTADSPLPRKPLKNKEMQWRKEGFEPSKGF